MVTVFYFGNMNGIFILVTTGGSLPDCSSCRLCFAVRLFSSCRLCFAVRQCSSCADIDMEDDEVHAGTGGDTATVSPITPNYWADLEEYEDYIVDQDNRSHCSQDDDQVTM